MFERIVYRELPRRVARRGLYSVFAWAMQAAVIGPALYLSAQPHAAEPAVEQSSIQIKFFAGAGSRRAVPRAFVPRAARPPGLPAGRRGPPGGRPAVASVKPPPPAALVQPREVTAAIRMPAPGEAPGEFMPGDWEGEGDEEGVVGGYAGGEEEFTEEITTATVEVEEVAQWAAAGFRRPAEDEPGCVGRSIRLPPDLAGFVSGQLTVKFAIGPAGDVREVMMLSDVPDQRITRVIENALRSCRWRPGADERGRAIAIWVILPVRFEAG